MDHFIFYGKCGSEGNEDSFHISNCNATTGKCDMKIGKVECKQVSSVFECVYSKPYSTSQYYNKYPPNNFHDIYKNARTFTSPCPDISQTCIDNTFKTNDIDKIPTSMCKNKNPTNYALVHGLVPNNILTEERAINERTNNATIRTASIDDPSLYCDALLTTNSCYTY